MLAHVSTAPGVGIPGYILCRFLNREVPRGSRRERRHRSRESGHLDSRKPSNRRRAERAAHGGGRSCRSREPGYPENLKREDGLHWQKRTRNGETPRDQKKETSERTKKKKSLT
ncbi:hypothetical protein NDU88_008320 [Pleurodeles waltl]|uniref:Uncharacterized protein n=1 Tax=Pleurodeles waltl TaxID=8319 RepID=A0AAV7VS65_PLEWA|nr:hypothetical protein NDU88_008320 [Pleurodeles waltl]